jgi:hypothetical protein
MPSCYVMLQRSYHSSIHVRGKEWNVRKDGLRLRMEHEATYYCPEEASLDVYTKWKAAHGQKMVVLYIDVAL